MFKKQHPILIQLQKPATTPPLKIGGTIRRRNISYNVFDADIWSLRDRSIMSLSSSTGLVVCALGSQYVSNSRACRCTRHTPYNKP